MLNTYLLRVLIARVDRKIEYFVLCIYCNVGISLEKYFNKSFAKFLK